MNTLHPVPDRRDAVPLAQLLKQAAAELSAQPAPPLPRAVFDAVLHPAVAVLRSATPAVSAATPAAPPVPSPAASARHSWWARLMPSRMGAAGSAGPTRHGSRWATVAAACSVMLVSVTVLLMLSGPGGGTGDATQPQPGFVPVAPQERWSRLHDDGGTAWVVTTELQQARLASYGLPFDPARAADTVRAELLMRSSGEVLAVRVLY